MSDVRTTIFLAPTQLLTTRYHINIQADISCFIKDRIDLKSNIASASIDPRKCNRYGEIKNNLTTGRTSFLRDATLRVFWLLKFSYMYGEHDGRRYQSNNSRSLHNM